jgi:hypothetical protein
MFLLRSIAEIRLLRSPLYAPSISTPARNIIKISASTKIINLSQDNDQVDEVNIINNAFVTLPYYFHYFFFVFQIKQITIIFINRLLLAENNHLIKRSFKH